MYLSYTDRLILLISHVSRAQHSAPLARTLPHSFKLTLSTFSDLSFSCLISSGPWFKVIPPLLCFLKGWEQQEGPFSLINLFIQRWTAWVREVTHWIRGLHLVEMLSFPQGVLRGRSAYCCPLICHGQPQHILKLLWSTLMLSVGTRFGTPYMLQDLHLHKLLFFFSFRIYTEY